jgi:hypothetical protein
MRFFFSVLVSSLALGACGLDPSLYSGTEGKQNNTSSDTAQPDGGQDSVDTETGSLSFDLTGIQIDPKPTDSGLEPRSLPPPSSDTFEFLLTGSKQGIPWVRKETFQAGQPIVSIGLLPVGAIKVELRVVNSEGVTSKSAGGEAKILPDQVTTLVLTLQSNAGKEDSGNLVIKVVDNGAVENLCKQGPLPPPLCALPPDSFFPPGKICSVTISGKAYNTKVGYCAPQVEFRNYLCDQGATVIQSALNGVNCKDDAEFCNQIAGNFYSRQDASVVPFTNGCQRDELLQSGKAVYLHEIPALFKKGEVCTQAISHWSHPQSKETVLAFDGCQAAGLKLLGFTASTQVPVK